jgi:tetratricopeptide (TPR) repeat protein
VSKISPRPHCDSRSSRSFAQGLSILSRTLARILVSICLLGCPICIRSECTVLVLPLANGSDGTTNDHWGYSLRWVLNDELSRTGAFRTPPDGSFEFASDPGLDCVLRYVGCNAGKALTQECARRIGELFRADAVVFGSYNRTSNVWNLSLHVLDVCRGHIMADIAVSSPDLFEIIQQAGDGVARSLHAPPLPAEQKLINQRRFTRSYGALELFSKAFALTMRGEALESVADRLRHAILLDPGFSAAYQSLACILLSQGKIQEALKYAKRAVRTSPDAAQAHYALGLAYLALDELRLAEDELVTAARIDPKEPSTYFRLGELYETQEKWHEAVESLRKAVDLGPRQASLHAELGRAYIRTAQRVESLAELKLAERYDTGREAGLYRILAQVYTLLDDTPMAIKDYEIYLRDADEAGVDSAQVQSDRVTLASLRERQTPHFFAAPPLYHGGPIRKASFHGTVTSRVFDADVSTQVF